MAKMKRLASVGIAVLTALPALALAQPTSITGFVGLLNQALVYILTFFWIIAAIFIILAAFSYLTAGGDEEKLKSAKQKVIYAIVAIVVALLAQSIRWVVSSFLGATNPTTLQK